MIAFLLVIFAFQAGFVFAMICVGKGWVKWRPVQTRDGETDNG